jgi:hypothetical protein
MEIKKLVESFNSSRRNFINWKKQNVTIPKGNIISLNKFPLKTRIIFPSIIIFAI